ncbi:YopX family protein [Enterococcus avium]|uniref:YopX family protein n=1 Tax=Enterococcus avium TaxID=33945 RepID=UPI003DA2C669
MIPKFRAWDKYHEIMVIIISIDFERKITYVGREDGDRWEIHFDNLNFMQSTGLKDKNGVEIFEGNIVNYDDGEFSYIGSVKKDCYQFYINGIEPVDSYDFIDVSNTFDGTTSLTILGNIYENPELLEAIE